MADSGSVTRLDRSTSAIDTVAMIRMPERTISRSGGAGNQQMMGAAPVHRSSDWYLFRQIQNFRAGIRGARPGDQGGALMRPMIAKLTGEQDIKDVVAYITTLAN